MPNRRDFIKTSAILFAGLNSFGFKLPSSGSIILFDSNRPGITKRNFVSEAIDAEISSVKNNIADEELAWMFENCFPNTLDTTVKYQPLNGKPDTFVITGDINAMWLRDSSAQVWPYLRFINDDKKLKDLITGVINRQAKCILIDPYANAFNFSNEGSGWETDITKMKPELHERKWEIDSLCYPVRLSYGYWTQTSDSSCFDSNWQNAMRLVVKTFREQQRINHNGPYSFMRNTTVSYDTVPLHGYGNSTKKIGLIHSMFRPSDDACIYPFLIPSNLMAAESLKQLAEIFSKENFDSDFADECKEFSQQLNELIDKFAIARHSSYGKIYAFEIDGFGNSLYMDDANVPNLLSLPYLGVVSSEDEIYKNTRAFILSEDNPYYFKGKAAEGIGGPHVGLDMIWPLGIIMRALTSSDDKEIISCLKTLKATHAGTGFMHESFHKDNPEKFTRKWFAWANTLFGELIIKIHDEKPNLLKNRL
jgi:meiotically up-regulated gene 157 (Mug157) protein